MPKTAARIPVEPTVDGRTFAYDFLRGLAILGILVANIPHFGQPRMSDFSHPMPLEAGPDRWVSQFTVLLVAGKFRSMLAVLFGVGLWLQYQKRLAIPGNWPSGYVRRMMILAGIGLLHGLFVWYGDILFLYAAAGLLGVAAVSWKPSLMKAAIAGVGLLAAGASGLLLLSGPDLPESGAGPGMAQELQVFGRGSYSEQLSMRAVAFLESMQGFLLYLPFVMALLLLGVLLAKNEVLRFPSHHSQVVRRMLWIGFGTGLPLCTIAAIGQASELREAWYVATELLFGPLLAIGLLALFAIVAERHAEQRLPKAVAWIGQMALSNYLLQSILGTAIFYSWGLGWFGQLDRLELLGVAPLILLANFAFTSFWLGRFRIGPVEWLWRSLSEGHRFSLRREAVRR